MPQPVCPRHHFKARAHHAGVRHLRASKGSCGKLAVGQMLGVFYIGQGRLRMAAHCFYLNGECRVNEFADANSSAHQRREDNSLTSVTGQRGLQGKDTSH